MNEDAAMSLFDDAKDSALDLLATVEELCQAHGMPKDDPDLEAPPFEVNDVRYWLWDARRDVKGTYGALIAGTKMAGNDDEDKENDQP